MLLLHLLEMLLFSWIERKQISRYQAYYTKGKPALKMPDELGEHLLSLGKHPDYDHGLVNK